MFVPASATGVRNRRIIPGWPKIPVPSTVTSAMPSMLLTRRGALPRAPGREVISVPGAFGLNVFLIRIGMWPRRRQHRFRVDDFGAVVRHFRRFLVGNA